MTYHLSKCQQTFSKQVVKSSQMKSFKSKTIYVNHIKKQFKQKYLCIKVVKLQVMNIHHPTQTHRLEQRISRRELALLWSHWNPVFKPACLTEYNFYCSRTPIRPVPWQCFGIYFERSSNAATRRGRRYISKPDCSFRCCCNLRRCEWLRPLRCGA